ncbi:hypothetical protein H0H92_011993 [Tricholoma furcatifolium]|nr:hypothetical protein H0H92_011993 [Tricholoma furcatifolium]
MVPRDKPDAEAAARIKGNVSEEEKRVALQIFSHFVSTPEKSYGADVGQRIKLIELNVLDRGGPTPTGEAIFEIEVTKGPPQALLNIWNAGELCVSAVHSTVNPWSNSKKAAKGKL